MDKETATKQIAAITQALNDVSKDLKVYSSVIQNGMDAQDLESIGKVSQSYVDLVASIRTLNRSARGPVDMVIAQIENASFQNPHYCIEVQGWALSANMITGYIYRGSKSFARSRRVSSIAT